MRRKEVASMETIDLETFLSSCSGQEGGKATDGETVLGIKYGSLPKLHVSGTCRGIILRRISRESRFSTWRWLRLGATSVCVGSNKNLQDSD